MNKLLELLKLDAKEINDGFKRASIEGRGTPQEVADRRESIVQEFFAKYFPLPFRIAKGNIIDSFGGSSNSIDCIILNPSHPHTVNKENVMASIIFADAVDFAIEIKPDLTSKTEIERALKQIESVKKLKRVDNSTIPGIIFSNKTYSDIGLLVTTINKFYIDNNIPYENQFDLLLVNNRTLIFNVNENSIFKIAGISQMGMYSTIRKEESLAMLLIFMNRCRLSEIRIRESILLQYLREELNKEIIECIYPYD